MDETTMEVVGRVTLHKVRPPREGMCDGCFYINIHCKEASLASHGRDMPCAVQEYIWEVLECQQN